MNQKKYIEFHEELCGDWDYPGTARMCHDIPLSWGFKALCVAVTQEDKSSNLRAIASQLIALAVYRAGAGETAETAEAFCDRGRELSMRKNNDYASPGASTDPYAIFKNFLRCEQLGVCSVEAGFLVRLSDKVSRSENLMNRKEGPSVVDEKLEDTLLDIVNYTCLLMAYLKVKGGE